MDTKTAIRSRILEVRNAMTSEMVAEKSSQIIQKVLKTPEYEEAHNILLYADFNHEVMTRELFENAIFQKKRVYFPKCNPEDGTMEFYQVVSIKQLEHGYMGIFEPESDERYRFVYHKEEDSLVIVPGVAFDMNGYRIGYGKGYYDKYLKDKRQLTCMALSFSSQIVDEIPNDTHDIKMDKVVTEEIIYSFLRI